MIRTDVLQRSTSSHWHDHRISLLNGSFPFHGQQKRLGIFVAFSSERSLSCTRIRKKRYDIERSVAVRTTSWATRENCCMSIIWSSLCVPYLDQWDIHSCSFKIICHLRLFTFLIRNSELGCMRNAERLRCEMLVLKVYTVLRWAWIMYTWIIAV